MCLSSKMFSSIISVCILVITISAQKSDYFTSITGMRKLLKLETEILENLDKYLDVRNDKIKHLEKYINELSKYNSLKNLNERANQFIVMKRLTKDLDHIMETLISDDRDRINHFIDLNVIQEDQPLPSSNIDLRGAALALARLQEVYKLNTSDLIKGKIQNHQANIKMTVTDIFELGVYLAESEKYTYYSIEWLIAALNHFNAASDTDILLKLNILNRLATSYEKEKHYRKALETITKIVALHPGDILASQKKSKLIIQVMKDGNSSKFKRNRDIQLHRILERQAIEFENPLQHTDPLHTDQYQIKIYEALCRGDIKPKPSDTAELHCKYESSKTPFIKIAPLKYEEISLDPYIILYHDVIYDAEIEKIKSLSRPILERAGVVGYDGEKPFLEYTDDRSGKLAWFFDSEHKFVADVSKRVNDMTGLSMTFAEQLQVLNYGIAGQYDLHFDFALDDDLTYEDDRTGNRVATVLIYLSDVTEGGATAFPLIKKAIFPKKGTAVVWYNLYASGEYDIRTKHAGCPVLLGSKWICNKWMHFNDQQKTRPCKLQPDHP